MKPTDKSQTSHLPAISIKAQLAATHNTTFPFSSPNVDENASLRSGWTGNTALSRNPLESPASSYTALTDYECGGASDYDEWHLERYSQQTADKKSRTLRTEIVQKRRRQRPGLQIVTDFPKLTYRTNDILITEVQARQTQARFNKARSVVSQKGVKVDAGTPRSEISTKILTSLKDLVHSKKQKSQTVTGAGNNTEHTPRTHEDTSIQSSGATGLYVLSGEARILQQTGSIDNAGTLHTPCTPAIILTPPIEKLLSLTTLSHEMPASSHLPVLTNGGQTLMSRNPFRKQHEPDSAHLGDDEASSANTPRSRSDGWWTLMLSPMLSRAGSVMSKRGYDANESPPPVPAIPVELEKQISAMTPRSHTSPETPRRLGLASPPESSWSEWDEKGYDEHADNDMHNDPHGASRLAQLHEKEFPLIMTSTNTNEGLAAEYFHACAVEQLAGIAYFECINHSCSEHLPKLRSIFDFSEKLRPEIRARGNIAQFSKRDTTSTKSTKSTKSTIGIAILPLSVEERDTGSHNTGIPDQKVRTATDLNPTLGKYCEIKQPSSHAAVSTTVGKELAPTSIDGGNEPDELSPTVRKADTAAVVRARALDPQEASASRAANKVVHDHELLPNIAAVVPIMRSASPPQAIPADLRKGSVPQKAMLSGTATSVSDLGEPEAKYGLGLAPGSYREPRNQPTFLPPPHQLPPNQMFFNDNTSYPEIPRFAQANTKNSHDVVVPKRSQSSERSEHMKPEKSAKQENKGSVWTRCFSRRKHATDDQKKKKKKKKRRLLFCILLLLIIVIAICLSLAMTLTRKGDETPVSSRWLNLTGYPPMPTGISTVAQPNLARSESRCASPEAFWSCSLPQEDRVTVEPNEPTQPNFRFEIKFRNGTTPADMTIALHKRATDPFTNDLFTASPSPPNQVDQIFLGTTTDNITAPFDGEKTPFYITFMSSYPVIPQSMNLTKRMEARQNDVGSLIPPPGTEDDGTAAPVALLPTDPYPVSQPVRLYNRGKNDEHYGFYMYYDKSIFLSGFDMDQSNSSDSTSLPVEETAKVAASVRCTWQQTRFLVKMYTNSLFDAVLLERSTLSTTDTSKTDDEKYNSAIDFSRPGSFPYPTTIAIDRHGGDFNTKIGYCYGMSGGKINTSQKKLLLEKRAFGGQLVNPAPAILDTNADKFNTSIGGIDGGTGGCGCWWQNWR